jgi:pimeloyl-ACP methyl ester carboxylesterase
MLAPQGDPNMASPDGLQPVREALDDWLDRRFEHGAPLEPLLDTLAAAGLDAGGVEALLRDGRARYPEPSHPRGRLSERIDLACDHVDHRVQYMVYLPRAYDALRAWPLVVIGHGGSIARDLEFGAWAARLGMEPFWFDAAETYGLVLVAPLTDRGWGAIGNSILMSAISRAVRDYHIDPDRIHVTGHSMGGHLAWRCGINFADRWGAVSPMSGGYDYVQDRQVENLLNVPGYATWGSDEPFRIAEYNRIIRAYMLANGYDWIHRECPGGHEIFPAEIPHVARFFLDHPRNLYRSAIRVRAGGPLEFNNPDAHAEWQRPHAWRAGRPIPVSTFHWLRLDPLPPGTPADQAVQQVDAVYHGNNAFAIKSVNARRLRLHLHPRMVDLSRDIAVTVNGAPLFTGRVQPDPGMMLRLVREFDDRGRVFHAALDLEIPEALRGGPLPA